MHFRSTIKSAKYYHEPYHAHVYQTTPSKAPTIIALHGCGGMLNAKGEPNNRTNEYATLLNAQGWHVVFLDSLSPRGVKLVCGGEPAAKAASQAALIAFFKRAFK